MINPLPTGWRLAAIEKIAGEAGIVTDGDWVETKDQDPNGDVRLIQLADVGDGQFLDRSSRYMTMEAAKRLQCTFLKPGDLLIARMPDPLGRACIFPGLRQPAVIAVDVLVWRGGANSAHAEWLMHAINSPDVRERLSSLAGGTTRQRVSGGNIKRLNIPVPPLAEQRRIVARIEALFARTRRARADLEGIAPLAHHLNVVSVDVMLRNAAPKWMTIGELATVLQYGSSAKTDDDSSGVPVLRMGNIANGKLHLAKLKYLPRDHHEFPSLLLAPGDIVFNRTNSAELVGKTAVYLGEPSPCSFASYLIRLRVKGLRPQLLAAYINSPAGREWAASVVSQQVGQANINGTKLRAFRVPVMPEDVQEDEESKLLSTNASIRKTEVAAARALALLDRLEQSILTRAFRGELVPQNPADEPARLPPASIALHPRRRRVAPSAAP